VNNTAKELCTAATVAYSHGTGHGGRYNSIHVSLVSLKLSWASVSWITPVYTARSDIS